MKLYVGNLSFNTTEQQFGDMFKEHGQVSSAVIVTDRDTGKSRGFGFVEMPDAEAQVAMTALNGRSIDGRDISVSQARERTTGSAKRSGDGH
jgi:cold-inducible RNA-binding protein